MIDNISVLFNNSKLVNAFKRKGKLDVIDRDSSNIEEAKAKVQAIIDSGAKKRAKRKKHDE